MLRKWVTALQTVAAARQADEGVVFFNNCVSTQAVENARRLAELLRQVAPDVHVIDPPVPPTRQPSLFEDG